MFRQRVKSKIHGFGVFANSKIAKGQVVLPIGSSLLDGFNHSCNPNLGKDESSNIVALRDIESEEELTRNYEEHKPKICLCFECIKRNK